MRSTTADVSQSLVKLFMKQHAVIVYTGTSGNKKEDKNLIRSLYATIDNFRNVSTCCLVHHRNIKSWVLESFNKEIKYSNYYSYFIPILCHQILLYITD